MKKHILAALAVLAFSGAASAQVYGTASAGVSRSSFDCLGAPSCDKSDTAFKIVGGYKFLPNLGAEIGYFDFGKQTLSGGGASLEYKNNGFGLGVAYLQDIGSDWSFVGRLGVAQIKTKLTGSIGGVSASDSDKNTALYGGLGLGYRVTPQMSIDGAWDFSRGKYNKNGIDESGHLNALSVGVTYRF